MLDTPIAASFPPATDPDGNLLLGTDEAQALLRECFVEFKLGMRQLVAMSIETTNDLFEMNEYVTDEDTAQFRSKRGEWVKHFEETLTSLFEQRLAGKRRSGRRPDFDASLTTLRVLNAFDQEKQAALTAATRLLQPRHSTRSRMRSTCASVCCCANRVRATLTTRSPPDYLLDAIGVASRALYPNPRIWRPLMERMLADVTPGINKVYIRINRFLAEHHVLARDQGRVARAQRAASRRRFRAAAGIPATVQGGGPERRRRTAGAEHRRAGSWHQAMQRCRAPDLLQRRPPRCSRRQAGGSTQRRSCCAASADGPCDVGRSLQGDRRSDAVAANPYVARHRAGRVTLSAATHRRRRAGVCRSSIRCWRWARCRPRSPRSIAGSAPIPGGDLRRGTRTCDAGDGANRAAAQPHPVHSRGDRRTRW